MDRLLGIEIFVKAVELGSFSAAGEMLQMSPQLVGKHVRLLEQHLGVRLLNRTTRRQHLTDVGRQFYERAKNILAEMDAAENMAAEVKAVPTGKLRINAPVTFGIHALTPLLPEYMQRYPEVAVEMSITNRMVDAIDEGFDVVFRVGELSDSGLIARALAPYQLIMCAAPEYLAGHAPIHHPEDLRQHECLGFSHTELRTVWTFHGPEGLLSVPVTGRLMVDSGEALLSAALAGVGILLQPSELVRKELASGRLIQVLPDFPVPTRPMHLLYAPDRRMTPKLRSFIDFAVRHFGVARDSPDNSPDNSSDYY